MMELTLKEGKRNQQLYKQIVATRDERIKSLKAEIEGLEGERRRRKAISVQLEKEKKGLQKENAALKEAVRSCKAKIAAIKAELVAREDVAERTASLPQKSSHDGTSELVDAASDVALIIWTEVGGHIPADSISQIKASETAYGVVASLMLGDETLILGDAMVYVQPQISEAASVLEPSPQVHQIIQKLNNQSYKHFLVLSEIMQRSCDQINQALISCSLLCYFGY
ncbi:MAG: hypothetical protein Q9160_001062 [Pyrenula sp. 1 TL-2023]